MRRAAHDKAAAIPAVRTAGPLPALSRRQALAWGGAVAAGLAGARPARADDWPNRPIKMIVAYGAGGSNDVAARIVAKFIGAELGQPVVVMDYPGAGGTLGANVAARSAPDGYTLFMAASAHVIAPSLFSKLPYDIVADFAPVSLVGRGSFVVMVRKDLPVNSVQELIAYSKQPGRNLHYASTGVGASPHLAGAKFVAMTGAPLTHVPYKSEPEAANDMMGGQVEVGFLNVGSSTVLMREGKLRGLAVTGANRVPSLPDLPTLAECGLPGYDVGNWWGLIAPARTPAAITERLNAAVRKAAADPEYKKLFAVQSMELATSPSPQAFGEFIKSEKDRYAAIVKTADIKPE